MLLTLTKRPTYLTRIKRFFPWLGMALCLAALGGHLALDLAGRKSAAGRGSGVSPDAGSRISRDRGSEPADHRRAE